MFTFILHHPVQRVKNHSRATYINISARTGYGVDVKTCEQQSIQTQCRACRQTYNSNIRLDAQKSISYLL